MKKNFKYFALIWAVGFVLFNAITFLVPNEVFGVTRFDKVVFWIAYALIAAAFAMQLVTAYIFAKASEKEKTFLKVPVLKIGYCAVVVSLIVGLAFMIFPVLPAWVGAIVCLLVSGYFIIACVRASAAATVVSDVGEKVKQKTSFLRSATVEAENVMARAASPEIKAEAKKVYEALRFSDPMSSPELESLEREISDGLNDLKQAVLSGDNKNISIVSESLLLTIKERNGKCRLLK